MYTLRSQPQQPVPRHGMVRAKGHNCGECPRHCAEESFDPGTLKRALWMEPGAERQNWPQDSASQTVTGRG